MATLKIYPNGDSAVTWTRYDFGTNWQNVKYSDDNFNLLEYGRDSWDIFTFDNHSSEAGPINDITMYVYINAHYYDDFYLKIGSYNSGVMNAQRSPNWDAYTISGSGWSWTDIDNLTGGIRGVVDNNPYADIQCHQLYISVNYTAATAPTVSTTAISSGNVGGNYGNVHGNITATGGDNCTARGVCYNTTGSPTTSSSKVTESGSFGTGAFYCALSGLSVSTKYYCKAYATNGAGTSYGSEVNFTTSSEIYNNLFIFGG